jgi:hypothetical protein
MWTGDGWIRTRRQLGVAGLISLFVAEIGFHVGVPIGLYGLVASLLGLDVLVDALSSLRVGGNK